MRNRPAVVCLLIGWLAAAPADAQLILSPKPLRIVLLVDSSSEVSSIINPFRAGLKAFLDGVANAFLDTMLESDQRFLRRATDRRQVFVILTTDNGAQREEPRIDDY